jgi:hypothetical protein
MFSIIRRALVDTNTIILRDVAAIRVFRLDVKAVFGAASRPTEVSRGGFPEAGRLCGHCPQVHAIVLGRLPSASLLVEGYDAAPLLLPTFPPQLPISPCLLPFRPGLLESDAAIGRGALCSRWAPLRFRGGNQMASGIAYGPFAIDLLWVCETPLYYELRSAAELNSE